MELAIINGTYRDPSAKCGQSNAGVSGGVVGGIAVGGGKSADLLSICKYIVTLLKHKLFFVLFST